MTVHFNLSVNMGRRVVFDESEVPGPFRGVLQPRQSCGGIGAAAAALPS
jgi:hypothetical protein